MLPLGQITEEHFDDIFDRNVKGVLFTGPKALPLLARGASVDPHRLDDQHRRPRQLQRLQCQQGGGAQLRAQLDPRPQGPRHPREHAGPPGATETPGQVELAGTDKAQQQGLLDHLASRVPLGRAGRPDEIANAAVFVVSDAASFVNGIEMFVDGGQAQV